MDVGVGARQVGIERWDVWPVDGGGWQPRVGGGNPNRCVHA